MATAVLVVNSACPKLVKDMNYEARIQALITFHTQYIGAKMTKVDARTMRLTQE